MEDTHKDEEQGLSRLHIAAALGDTETVRNLLMSSATCYVLYTKHVTPSHKVTLYRRVDVVDLPLSKGAGVNAGNALGQTPLHMAAENGHIAIVQLLLNSMADVNAVCKSQWTPLHLAAFFGHADIVQNLIRYGTNVNACTDKKVTALHLACQNGHILVVGILLDNHATVTVDLMKQSDETPFYIAAACGHADVADLLLRRGVCDFVLTNDKETPLHVAVKQGYTEVVEVILKHSSRISGKLINCGYKLQETSGIQRIQLLRYGGRPLSAGIIWSEEKKPLVEWEDKYARTALLIAAKSVQPKMVKLLLNTDQDTYSEGHLGQVFYHLRGSNVHDMVTYCRSNNEAATDLSDAEKYKMFSENIKEIAQALISSSRFDINHRSLLGHTLIYDVITDIGCVQNVPYRKIHMICLMQLLLENGADFNMKNSYGETPLMIASKHGCCDAIQLLFDWEQKSGIQLDLDARDQLGETALIKAVASYDWCHYDEVQSPQMHKSGIEIDSDARDRYGTTALMKAAERNHVSVIRLLLDHKATVNLCDYYGLTALHAAIYERKTNWFDMHCFCKDRRKQNFDDASNSLATSSREQLQLRAEIMDHHRLIDWLQSHIEFIEGTILSRVDVPNNNIMRRKSGDPHIVFDRLLSNTRHRLEAVKLLLDNAETKVDALDYRGYTPLDLLLESAMEIDSTGLKTPKNCGTIRDFREAPIEVGTVDDRGRNALHRLIIYFSSDCLYDYFTDEHQDEAQFDLMVKQFSLNKDNFGASATATDNKGRTPLHYAVMGVSVNNMNKSVDTIQMVLSLGSDIDSADIYGKTPLHYAATDHQYNILVYFGADENTKDNFGYSPRDLKMLRDLVTTKENNAYIEQDMNLNSPVDIAQVLNTSNHVADLTTRKVVETIRIYSQSPRPGESPEKAIWKIWTENDFIRLNKRLNQLKPSVKHFIKRLTDGVKEKDWRFECQPILVGSSEEETKVLLSGDFDYNFRLIKFSQFCYPFPHPLGQKGYFELKRKINEDRDSRDDESFDIFFNLDNCLLTDEVNCRFKVILEEVLSDPDLWQSEHQFDWNMKHKYSSLYGNIGGMCTTIRLRMLNPIADGEGGFLFVNISIDVVACIHVEDWWPEDALQSVKAECCTLNFIFRRPGYGVCKSRGTHFFFSDTYAKLSFVLLENRIIRESSPLIKAAYMVCKMIIHFVDGSTYQLKTCLLFCMEALNARNGNETKVEDKITPNQLAFWVERIMFCFTEFSLHRVFPCYFMSSFRLEGKYPGDGYIKYMDEKDNRELIMFSYCKPYDLYLNLCPDDTAIDISVEHSIDISVKGITRLIQDGNLDQNYDPLWERFEREEFTRSLSSRRSY